MLKGATTLDFSFTENAGVMCRQRRSLIAIENHLTAWGMNTRDATTRMTRNVLEAGAKTTSTK